MKPDRSGLGCLSAEAAQLLKKLRRMYRYGDKKAETSNLDLVDMGEYWERMLDVGYDLAELVRTPADDDQIDKVGVMAWLEDKFSL